MGAVLEVSPSGFYNSRRRAPEVRAIADEVLMARVRIIHRASGETYGAPQVQRDLRGDGIRVGTKRVARRMRQRAAL
ncbi:MAG: IS3 family transposase [Gemmatimonadaceae bacterium]|nr:IS3 family transposase [Gemmatimonadaceae bacterium]